MHWPVGRRGRIIPPNPCHCEGHGTDFLCKKYCTQKTVLLLEGEAKPISELLVRAGVERRHLGEALFPSPRAIMSPKSAKVSFFGDLWLSANPRQRHPKTATLQPFWSKTPERNSQCEATTCDNTYQHNSRSLTRSQRSSRQNRIGL